MLLAAAVADDTGRRGLQTLIASGSPADAGEATAATRAMAASSRAACCDAAGEGGESGCEGCLVSYGWRRSGVRRLPPPIPSLGRLALVRARTSDGRLLISREEAAHRVCGEKVEGRLVLGLVDGGDDTAAAPTAPPPRRWSHPLAAQDASAPAAIDDEEAVHDEGGRHAAVQSPALAPTSFPACFGVG